MPVIGRLDDQVDKVLIEPLSKKGGREDARANVPAQPSVPLPSPDDSPSDDDATGPKLRPRELPVWLL